MTPSTLTRDVFLPRHEPARTLYLAFQAEAGKRSERSFSEWGEAEIGAVHAAAMQYAQSAGVTPPTLEEVRRAERNARGSIDYGAQWAYQLADVMRSAVSGKLLF